jgi:hypothetical protein
MQVPVTAVKILDKNPYRILYSIHNHDAANYITLGCTAQVTAGVYGTQEGDHLFAGQPMSDDTDQAEVWAIANTLPVNITIREISEPEAFGVSFDKKEKARERRPARLASRTY